MKDEIAICLPFTSASLGWILWYFLPLKSYEKDHETQPWYNCITINYVVYQLDMELTCTQLYRQLIFLNYADLESQLCTTSFTTTYYEVLIIIHFRTFEHARKPAFGSHKNYCRSLLLKEQATKSCIKNLDFAHRKRDANATSYLCFTKWFITSASDTCLI